MPDIAPGRFVRYAGRRELSAVVCPPYDVIDEAEQRALEERDPHNFVRLILPRAEEGDSVEARYRRSRAELDRWLSEGVLTTDDEPSMLAVEQTFVLGGETLRRRGLFALVKLSDFSEGRILPHERTLSGPKEDRLRLLDAVGAQLSPIFVLYPDPHDDVLGSLADVFARPPDLEAELSGVVTRAFRIVDERRLSYLRDALAPTKGYIADGHHRYETALEFRRRARAAGRDVDGTQAEYIPALLCGMSEPGLVILPTHRLLHSLDVDGQRVMAELARFFDVEPLGATEPAAMSARLAEAGRSRPSFALLTHDPPQLLQLKPDAPLNEVKSLPASKALRSLDVTLLHAVVFEHAVGMSRESQEKQEHLRYSKRVEDVLAQVRGGEVVAGFLVNPTPMEQVREVAEAGESMPQKSTWFFPKIVDGLALARLDERV